MQVSSLMIYPVKSLGCQPLQSAVVEARGLRGDRRLMLVDTHGRFVTQREIPALALIAAQWQEQQLHLSCRGQSLVVGSYAAQADGPALQARNVRVWNDDVVAVDMGDAAATMVSQWAGRELRLVYMGDDSLRRIDPQYARAGDIVSFADGFPVLLVGAASVDHFNSHLSVAVSAHNFRPNIVVTGAAPYAEDDWRRIRVGSVEFDVVKPCSRCVVPSIDPATAQKQGEVTRALAAHRRGSDGKTYFGQNLIARGAGVINVGDVVEVLR